MDPGRFCTNYCKDLDKLRHLWCALEEHWLSGGKRSSSARFEGARRRTSTGAAPAGYPESYPQTRPQPRGITPAASSAPADPTRTGGTVQTVVFLRQTRSASCIQEMATAPRCSGWPSPQVNSECCAAPHHLQRSHRRGPPSISGSTETPQHAPRRLRPTRH